MIVNIWTLCMREIVMRLILQTNGFYILSTTLSWKYFPWKMALIGLPLLSTMLEFLSFLLLGPFYMKKRTVGWYRWALFNHLLYSLHLTAKDFGWFARIILPSRHRDLPPPSIFGENARIARGLGYAFGFLWKGQHPLTWRNVFWSVVHVGWQARPLISILRIRAHSQHSGVFCRALPFHRVVALKSYRDLPARDPATVELRHCFLGSEACFKRTWGVFPAKRFSGPSLPVYSPCKVQPPALRIPVSPHHMLGAQEKPRSNERMRSPSAQGQVDQVFMKARVHVSQSSISYGNKKN